MIYFYLFIFLRIISFFLGLDFLLYDFVIILEFKFIELNRRAIIMIVLLDWIRLIFISFVLFISSIVIFYREDYIRGDKFINRFIILVVIFVLSIILLIIRPNLIRILLGWDGLGLVSYCLVIYYQNVKSYNAGLITALTNRIGDVALLICISWMLNYGRWNFIFYLDYINKNYYSKLIIVLIFLAAITKRAQIPFSSWLPAAIAAPTPVSSLVHSSTLVTAGIYLLVRFNNLFYGTWILRFILILGVITMFMAGLGANFEFDLKKIIALSTLSQLGLIIRMLGLMEINLTFFHLLSHALFKATLFICAGSIIHNISNCQDIRYMGGLVYKLPITISIFNISNLSLIGLPFLSGFYSKDLILEVISMNYINIFIYLLYYISTGLTVCYRIRLVYYTLLGDFNYYRLNLIEDSRKFLLLGIIGLFIFVIMGGCILSWLIFIVPVFILLPIIIKLITLLVILLGAIVGYEISLFNLNYSLKSLKLYNVSIFLSLIWGMPILSIIFNKYVVQFSYNYYKIFDHGWLEYYGAQNLYNNIIVNSSKINIIYFKNYINFLLSIFFIIIVIFINIYLSSLIKSIILKILG